MILTGLSAFFVGLVVYGSLQVKGHTCDLCIEFRGQRVCRTGQAATEHEARQGAVTAACAVLAGGVTDTIACERSELQDLHCVATE